MDDGTIRAALAGDRDALETFAGAVRRYAAGTATALRARPWDVDDVAQDVAMLACSRLADLRNPGAWRGWIGTATRRRLADLRRKDLPDLMPDGLPDDAAPVEVDPGTVDADPGPAVRDLPGQMRRAVVLHYFRGLTVAETARAMGTTRNTVRSSLRKARARLAVAVAEGRTLAEVDA